MAHYRVAYWQARVSGPTVAAVHPNARRTGDPNPYQEDPCRADEPRRPRRAAAYLADLAHPWGIFVDAGYAVDVVSIAGGEPPVDGVDLSDPIQRAFTEDERMGAKVRGTQRFAEVDPAEYDAVFFVGGHGTMWDFPHDPDLAAFTNAEEAAAGLVGVVPFLLQTRLEELGAKHTGGPDFQAHVVTDGRLVTGQNPASATGVARAVLAALDG